MSLFFSPTSHIQCNTFPKQKVNCFVWLYLTSYVCPLSNPTGSIMPLVPFVTFWHRRSPSLSLCHLTWAPLGSPFPRELFLIGWRQLLSSLSLSLAAAGAAWCKPYLAKPRGHHLHVLLPSSAETQLGVWSWVYREEGWGSNPYCLFIFIKVWLIWGFPCNLVSKESACNAGDPGLIPGSGRSPGEGNGYPLQCSCLENSMDRGALWATVHGITESQTRLRD